MFLVLSYEGTDGNQLVAIGDMENAVALGSGGAELVITRQNNGATTKKMLGSRDYLRYYRQKHRPTALHSEITAALASRYAHCALSTQYQNHGITHHLLIGFGG